jgi:hypothetical protein
MKKNYSSPKSRKEETTSYGSLYKYQLESDDSELDKPPNSRPAFRNTPMKCAFWQIFLASSKRWTPKENKQRQDRKF